MKRTDAIAHLRHHESVKMVAEKTNRGKPKPRRGEMFTGESNHPQISETRRDDIEGIG